MKATVVIGAGFSGLSAACYLAKSGRKVSVIEKNADIGGRARQFESNGFTFDMGPSWYWMPDVFDSFFADFGKTTETYYDLKKLDPGFQVFFGDGSVIAIPDNREQLNELFESIEKGSSKKLEVFLQEAAFKYEIGMRKLVYKPALSWMEFASYEIIAGALKSHMFRSMRSYVRQFFKHEKLAAIMEFPVLFLGAKPSNIPALYSLMNYAALEQGTFYPMGGMYKVVEGMQKLAESLGVNFETDCQVNNLVTTSRQISGVETSNGYIDTESVIASADYQHVEQTLLAPGFRNYSPAYWEKKTMAPSCLIFFLGVNKRVNNLIHHNLFFDTDFDRHSAEIYDRPKWPTDPLFYVSCPSKTDPGVAPAGMENLFILIPIAPGLTDSDKMREKYFEMVLARMEHHTGDKIAEYIIYKRSYCLTDFETDYHAYKGNAYGLANTLRQTAVLKPSIRNKHIPNLFYTGQLTVPGPGVPPAIISGKIAAQQTLQYLKSKHV